MGPAATTGTYSSSWTGLANLTKMRMKDVEDTYDDGVSFLRAARAFMDILLDSPASSTPPSRQSKPCRLCQEDETVDAETKQKNYVPFALAKHQASQLAKGRYSQFHSPWKKPLRRFDDDNLDNQGCFCPCCAELVGEGDELRHYQRRGKVKEHILNSTDEAIDTDALWGNYSEAIARKRTPWEPGGSSLRLRCSHVHPRRTPSLQGTCRHCWTGSRKYT